MGAWWVGRDEWWFHHFAGSARPPTVTAGHPFLSLSTFSLLLSQLMHHWLLHNISLSLFHSFSLSSTACTPSDCWRPKGNAKKKSMIIINFFFSGFEFCWWLVAVMIDSSVEFLHQGWFDFAFLLESNGGFLFSRVTEQWKIYDSKF